MNKELGLDTLYQTLQDYDTERALVNNFSTARQALVEIFSSPEAIDILRSKSSQLENQDHHSIMSRGTRLDMIQETGSLRLQPPTDLLPEVSMVFIKKGTRTKESQTWLFIGSRESGGDKKATATYYKFNGTGFAPVNPESGNQYGGGQTMSSILKDNQQSYARDISAAEIAKTILPLFSEQDTPKPTPEKAVNILPSDDDPHGDFSVEHLFDEDE